MLKPSRRCCLVMATFRFVAEEVVRSRALYFVGVLGGYFLFELVAAVSTRGESGRGFGSRFILVSLIVSAPLCRPWLSEDVRLGYGALWLQKPLAVLDYYLARIVAVVGWSVIVTLATALASSPASIGPLSAFDQLSVLVTLGWVPPTLAVLSFLGSALGARNSGLFAYSVLLAGFALPGLRDALWPGPSYRVLEVLLPPAYSALQARNALEAGQITVAAERLLPLVVYLLASAGLALAMALSTPKRLGRA